MQPARRQRSLQQLRQGRLRPEHEGLGIPCLRAGELVHHRHNEALRGGLRFPGEREELHGFRDEAPANGGREGEGGHPGPCCLWSQCRLDDGRDGHGHVAARHLLGHRRPDHGLAGLPALRGRGVQRRNRGPRRDQQPPHRSPDRPGAAPRDVAAAVAAATARDDAGAGGAAAADAPERLLHRLCGLGAGAGALRHCRDAAGGLLHGRGDRAEDRQACGRDRGRPHALALHGQHGPAEPEVEPPAEARGVGRRVVGVACGGLRDGGARAARYKGAPPQAGAAAAGAART
mmetsp:Transcript_8353/g.23206  ORF Transcript_8353/g.23206 Transcript_8353/m.23206 type:complete len:289 (-) Transcript_8353:236-1102(-)